MTETAADPNFTPQFLATVLEAAVAILDELPGPNAIHASRLAYSMALAATTMAANVENPNVREVTQTLTGAAVAYAVGEALPISLVTALLLEISIVAAAPPLVVAVLAGVAVGTIAFLAASFGEYIGDQIFDGAVWLFDLPINSPLLQQQRDPLILDLNGDGIKTTNVQSSITYFDYDSDGFAERTGWVSSDDGILIVDANGNGIVDNASELFGSSTQDGFAVLETLDENGDGLIDALDSGFASLNVWQDVDQDGFSDAGELKALDQIQISSVSLDRIDVNALNNGNTVGYEGHFTYVDGSVSVAQTLYFATNRQDSFSDNTPAFEAAEGVNLLPTIPGIGELYSIQYLLTNNESFRTDWTSLTDRAPLLSSSDLRNEFIHLLIKWVGSEELDPAGRGAYVDARHLSFVEAFFGEDYRELQGDQEVRTSPGSYRAGESIEATFQQIVTVLETVFLAQVTISNFARGEDITAALSSPYLLLSLLDLRGPESNGFSGPSFGNSGAVADLITASLPSEPGAATSYLTRALVGMEGMVTIAFGGDRAAYAAEILPRLSDMAEGPLKQIATAIVDGSALIGSSAAEGLGGTDQADVFLAGGGGDFIEAGAGSDVVVYSKSDGNLVIRDADGKAGDVDRLIMTDLNSADVQLVRIADDLVIRVTATAASIYVTEFFGEWSAEDHGIDILQFADGVEWGRDDLQSRSVSEAAPLSNVITDSALDDVIRSAARDEAIVLSTGNDTILYGRGSGYDVVSDTSRAKLEHDKLILVGLNAADVEFARVGDDLTVEVKSSAEYIQFVGFFVDWADKASGVDEIQFADGSVVGREDILGLAYRRGGDDADSIGGSALSDTFVGGKGDDLFDGGDGDDTYIWQTGDGNDQIVDSTFYNSTPDTDTLWLKDVVRSDVRFSYQGDDLLIRVVDTNEIIRVSDFLTGKTNLIRDQSEAGAGIDRIKFADGRIMDRDAISVKIGTDYHGRDIKTDFSSLNGGITAAWAYDEFGNKWDLDIGFFASGYIYTLNNAINATVDGGFIDSRGYPLDMRLVEGSTIDSIMGSAYDDFIRGTTPRGYHNVINGREGNDTLLGGDGSDRLIGGAGNDHMIGGAGKDYLDGGSGEDIIDGRSGNDVLSGGSNYDSGSDTYLYELGDGSDTIYEASYELGGVGTDVLNFRGILPQDVYLTRSGFDLLVTVRSTNETIRVVDQFNPSTLLENAGAGIEYLRFDDGAEWTRAQMRSLAYFRGDEGRNIITGTSLGDTFIGGVGADVITSGYNYQSGNDRFIYSKGDGNDVIIEPTYQSSESSFDTLELKQIATDDIYLTRLGNNLLIDIISTGERIQIVDQFYPKTDDYGVGIEKIVFDDGSEWSRAQINDKAWYRGTDSRDRVVGSDFADTLTGGKGDDVLIGGSSFQNGSDTYVYNAGDGNDVIQETASYSWNDVDILSLQNIDYNNVILARAGDNLRISFKNSSNTIEVTGQFIPTSSQQSVGVEFLRFKDAIELSKDIFQALAISGSSFIAGTGLADTLTGSSISQVISGEAGNDVIDGKGGNDTVYGGLGDDRLVVSQSAAGEIVELNGGGGVDTVDFSAFQAAVLVDLVSSGAEARTTDTGSLGSGAMRDVAQILNVEGLIGSAFGDQLYGDAGNNRIVGGSGNDMIGGRSGDDILTGDAGDDAINGDAGNDTLKGGAGADTLDGGLDGDTADYGDMVLSVVAALNGATNAAVTVGGVAEDTIRNIENLIGGSGSDTLTGDSLANMLTGGAGNDILKGMGGVDVLDGGDGSDTVAYSDKTQAVVITLNGATDATVTVGGTVEDTIRNIEAVAGGSADDVLTGDSLANWLTGGTGNDILKGMGGIDVLDGSAGVDTADYSDKIAAIVATLNGATDAAVTVGGAAEDTIRNIENLIGGSGNDTLTGDGLANWLAGGTGNDILSGGAGNDVFAFKPGFGTDVIMDFIGGQGATDIIEFDASVFATYAAVAAAMSQSGTDTIITLDAGNTLTLKNFNVASLHSDDFRFV